MLSEEASKIIAATIGFVISHVEVVHSQKLTLQFSKLSTEQTNTLTDSEYKLQTRDCAWRLETSNAVLLGSGDMGIDDYNYSSLLGKKITKTSTLALNLELYLEFDEQTKLSLFPIRTNRYVHWAFSTYDNRTIVAGPGNQLKIK